MERRRTVGNYFGLGTFGIIVGLGVMAFPSSALSAIEGSRGADRCQSKLSKIDYSAKFLWGGKPARLQIGFTKELGKLQWIARIDSKAGCQAVCEVQRLEVDRFRASAPVSLDLKCQSSRFSPLETKATVLWVNEIQREPVLRFGSWLSGYQDANLSVEVDQFVKPMEVKTVKRAVSAPTKLRLVAGG